MQKNIVFIAQSLDGYIAGPNGELDWLDSIPNPDKDDMGYLDLMNEVDAIIMGRKSFDFLSSYNGDWPYSKTMYVLSTTLKQIPAHLHDKASLINGTPQEVLSQLHTQGHTKLYIDGGITITHFLRGDLIDELRITTLPILLGKGIPLFGELEKQMEFRLIKSEVYLGQLVQSHYARKP